MMSLKDAYIEMQQACGIKEGDKVKVLRKAEGREIGWANDWAPPMNDLIGKNGIVINLHDEYGVEVAFSEGHIVYYFPFFVLEKVEGCNFKPFDKVLIRDNDTKKWGIDLFFKYIENANYPYACLTDSWRQCILYENNEHLLGTTDSPEE